MDRLETLYNSMLAEAARVGWPAHYRNDLLVHDKDFLAAHQPMSFIWVLRECGTNVIPLDPLNRTLTYELRWFERYERDVKLYHASGDSIAPITFERANELVQNAITKASKPLSKSFCMHCVSVHHPRMLTGYCLTGCRCDGCGRVSDLAMVVPEENAKSFDERDKLWEIRK
jgi:hypothetical protein